MCFLNTISSNNPIMTSQQASGKLEACKQPPKEQRQMQSNQKLYEYRRIMKILLAIAACFIIHLAHFSSATTQVQERTTPPAMMAEATLVAERQSAATSQEPTLATTSPSRPDSKMTTITVFKIQKQALHNSSDVSEEQSWRLIDKSETAATSRTANELSHSSTPSPGLTEAASPKPSADSSSPAPPATVAFAPSSRSPSVLRPSIEEVASKLSRKHLNLQHNNWRLNKQSPSLVPSLSPSRPDDKLPPKLTDGSAMASLSLIEAEQDVQLPLVSSADTNRQQPESGDGSGVFSTAPISPKLSEGHLREHYLHITDAAPAATTTMIAEAASVANQPKSRQPGGGRRKKGASLLTGEAFEQSQCHQYLRIYNAPATSTNPGGLYQMMSNQQLPCSCEWRSIVFSADLTTANLALTDIDHQAPLTSWLSCDHVQLVGGYIQPQSSQGNSTSGGGGDTWNMGKVSADTNAAGDNTAGGSVQVTRFSQRYSGLQTLQAQKFLNLQLSNLRSVDLRDNRIRQIKMDAFHGLELSLENLNLANNLLGDSRAISYSAQNSNTQQQQQKQQHQQQSRGKLVFVTDEFNRLKKLRWLSLRNNQINQLSSTIFTKQSQSNNPSVSFIQDPTSGNLEPQSRDTADDRMTTTGELVYLDLSENILKSVPSDAIESLYKLQTLNLRENKITQLDQSSKFPKSLRYLDLSANSIKTIRNCDLIDLPDLIELNLSHNQLSQLDKTAFLSSSAAALAMLSSASNSNKLHQLTVQLNLDGTSAGSVGVVSSLSSSQSSNNLIVSNHAAASADSYQASGGKQNSQLLASGESSNNNNDELARFLASGVNEQGKSSSYLDHRTDREMGEDSLSLSLAADADASEFRQAATRRTLRTRRDVISSEDELTATGTRSSIMRGEEGDYDLDAEESGLSGSFAMLAGQQQRLGSGGQHQTMGDDEAGVLAMIRRQREFNSTIKLNLAYNYFTSLPGDSLLKFPNLQQLDLSYNRIRHLDSNYLCSIYNLVESLRELDLSGNLLTLPQSNTSSATPSTSTAAPATALPGEGAPVAATTATSGRQLNRLFGCLQRLERLSLATNRLSSSPPAGKRSKATSVSEESSVTLDDEEDEFNGRPSGMPMGADSPDRLHIKFGENFGSRYLNQLDLSDNQLRLMPLIEQVFQQPISLMFSNNGSQRNKTNSSSSAPTVATNDQQQQQLNQWMASRVYVVSLNLSYNYIDRLEERDFDHLFSLRQLSFDFNRLSSLPTKLMRKFTSLDRASFDGNRLSSLEPLNELFERSIKTLRYLNLANNRLTVWPAINKVLYENPLRQEYSPSIPVDSEDKQASALQFSLEELNLEGNLFTSSNVSTLFDQFTYMKSLRILNLSQNLLNRVRSEWFKFANQNLRILQLTGNKINSIDLGSFALNQVNELQKLQLDHNLLKELKRKTFDSLPKLRDLDLSHNFIHTINSESFHQMNTIQVLNLSNNKLTSWKCEYFSNLCNSISGNINADLSALLSTGVVPTAEAGNDNRQPVSALIELDLSHNSLSQLRVNSISVHTKLERLNLAYNKLSYIPHDLFKATILDSKTGRQIQLVSSLKRLNLAHNRIQTVDNINLRPLRNLINFDLSHNELQTLGVDVILIDNGGGVNERERNLIVSNENSTNLLMDSSATDATLRLNQQRHPKMLQQHQTGNGLPALGKLRHLNLSHNQLTQVNQSLLHELSPFVLLNLDLSHNYLESESLPYGFYAKISGPPKQQPVSNTKSNSNYDLVFTLKLESLTLSHNRLSEFPSSLLENHHISMESCNLAHNRIQTLVPNANILIQIKKLNLEFNPLNRESNELILFEHKSVRHLNLAATRLYAIKEVTQLATSLSDKSPQQLQQQQQQQQQHRLVANQTSQLDLIRSISRPIDAPYVQHLNLSSNQLVWLAANIFERMHSLQTLDLSNNQLTRLHLLTNQLAPLSASLEGLNLASNLFTSIDETDFGQLTRLQHLDLTSLLSLQKLNCRFLSKLTTLKSLRLFNFPQVRQNVNNIISTLQHKQQLAQPLSSNRPADSHASQSSERLMRKLQQELLMSTIGKHCFRDEALPPAQLATEPGMSQHGLPLKWLNLEELDLELLTTYGDGATDDDPALWIGNRRGGFQLEGELAQLLGPKTRRLTLFGQNLTSLAYDSLLGIASQQLDLKISYTSLARLPLEQVLNGVSKRTKLNLDFRNNNIQTLDVGSLQMLDELQLNNQILQRGDHSSLRLASNPMRCDCQTRPLWLWLNQRWANLELPVNQQQEEPADIRPTAGNSANYWLKFSSSVLQTSDIKCHYPAKLRGKLAQYVNYHDLVCKGSSLAAGGPNQAAGIGRQSRKRNETKPSLELSYYARDGALPSSPSGADFEDLDSNGGMGDLASDYWDSDAAAIDGTTPVRVTKFNRFPSLLFNQTIYYLQNIPVPFISDNHQDHNHDYDHHQRQPARTETDFDFEPDSTPNSARVSKRDRNSVDGLPAYPILTDRQIVNTKYSKHRPNTQQRHASFETLSTLRQFQPAHHHSGRKQTLLTDSDIYILTVMSIAMSIMSLVIITICLLKYRMDRSDKERILSDHGKMLMSQALFNINSNMTEAGFNHLQLQKHHHHHQQQQHSASGSRKSSSKKSSGSSGSSGSRSASETSSGKQKSAMDAAVAVKRVNLTTSHKLQTSPMKADTSSGQLRYALADKSQATTEGQVLVPMQLRNGGGAAQNFLMRSPTVRQMQGLATNASDWFKYTLRAYPSNAAMHRGGAGGHRRRRLFLGDTVPVVSQLTTGKQGIEEQLSANEPGSPATLAIGCPHHAFKAVDKLKDRQSSLAAGVDLSDTVIEERCLHCARLLATIQQTKVQYLIGSASNNLRPEGKQTCPPKQQQLERGKNEKLDHNNPDHQCFVPPSLIRALAEQLDQANAESNYVALGPEWLQQEQQEQQQQPDLHDGDPSLSSFSTAMTAHYKREQRVVRPMRSFGMTDRGSTDEYKQQHQMRKATGDVQPLGSPTAVARQSGSQIPSVDVTGRFAYQSDSQVDTPTPYDARCSSMLGGSSQMDGSEDTNGCHYNRDGVFILVPDDEEGDTSSSEDDRGEPVSVLLNSKSNNNNGSGRKQRAGSGNQCHRRDKTGNGAEDETMQSNLTERTDSRLTDQQEESSLRMQDECSGSSSPVAYGFMRNSGPSSLASSSAAASRVQHQQQPQLDHTAAARYLPSDHNHHHQPPPALSGHGRTNHYSSTSNNNNHIDDNYSVVRKKKVDESQSESAADSGNNNNEQLTISRL